MCKSKLIFLDIDGVVNTLMIDTKPFDYPNRQSIERDGGFYYDLCHGSDDRVSNYQAVMWLNKLCKETKAKIVISSTWRYSYSCEEIKNCLVNSGLLPEIEIIGQTPDLRYRNEFFRGDEIKMYLKEWYPEGWPAFVILDDDADMLDLIDHLVQTHTDRGFGYPDYLKALQVLEK